MRRVAYMAVLLVSSGFAYAAPATDAPSTTGLWKINGDVVGRPVNMMCQIVETDRKLSGSCSGAADGFVAHKVAGTVKAQKIQLYFQTSIGSGAITMIVSGTLNEDRSKMDGDLDVEPMAVSGTFAAVREPAIGARSEPESASATTEAPATAEATVQTSGGAPVVAGGTWKIDGDVQGNPVMLTCVLTQAEQKLSGTCAGAAEDKTPRTLAGEATEKGVGWHFDSEYQGQPITVSMKATLTADGAKMAGTMTVAPFDVDGNFVGVKQ
jgi:hypothetical protein